MNQERLYVKVKDSEKKFQYYYCDSFSFVGGALKLSGNVASNFKQADGCEDFLYFWQPVSFAVRKVTA